jgi:hypothetical protein
MRRALLVLLLLGSVSARAALEPPPPYFEDAVQDGSGLVWAYSHSTYGSVYHFDGNQWVAQAAPFQDRERVMPVQMVKMSDGAVACV